MTIARLDHYCRLWQLDVEGASFETPSSWLRPVRYLGKPAMLKVLKPESDEGGAASLLAYYGGEGAVRLYRADTQALLLERAMGERSLAAMASSGRDLAAASILADTLVQLHRERADPLPDALTSLSEQFSSLFERAGEDPLLARAAAVATLLLGTAQNVGPLHGDLHHNNVLDGEKRGWLAIDPKALIGERCYDVANLLRNPSSDANLVQDPERMLYLAAFYAERLGFERQRILAFGFAHAGLSAAWDIDDGLDPEFSLGCAKLLSALVSDAERWDHSG